MSPTALTEAMFDLPAEQIRDALERAAAELLAVAGVTAPPIDAVAIARALGVEIARAAPAHSAAETPRAYLVQRPTARPAAIPGTIYLADEPRAERRQWAVAHELGETQAFRVFAALGVEPIDAAPAAREAVANRLAGGLLLPRGWFLDAGRACDWDLFDLKQDFATASHELIARRMLEMPPPVVVTVWDNGQRGWRRSNAPGRVPPVTQCEADCRRAAHDLGDPARCDHGDLPDGIADVRAWPIHETEWKREIMRMELGEVW
jgi:hypothetical protein